MTLLDSTDHDDWLRDIRSQLTSLREESTSRLNDLLSSAAPTSELSAHAALVATTRQTLAEATYALQRIENGRYGTCESCSKVIPAERLEVRPQARYCVAC